MNYKKSKIPVVVEGLSKYSHPYFEPFVTEHIISRRKIYTMNNFDTLKKQIDRDGFFYIKSLTAKVLNDMEAEIRDFSFSRYDEAVKYIKNLSLEKLI